MTNTHTAAPARRSLIVDNRYTRRAYDAGVKAAEAGKLEESAALSKWEDRNWSAEWFDGDMSDAFLSGFSDTAAPAPAPAPAPVRAAPETPAYWAAFRDGGNAAAAGVSLAFGADMWAAAQCARGISPNRAGYAAGHDAATFAPAPVRVRRAVVAAR